MKNTPVYSICVPPAATRNAAFNMLRFVYNQFKSNDQSLAEKSFHFFKVFHAMKICAMNAKCRLLLKVPTSMVTWLDKTNLLQGDFLEAIGILCDLTKQTCKAIFFKQSMSTEHRYFLPLGVGI